MDSSSLIAVSAAIQGIVGFLVWVAVRRPIDNLSRENVEMKRSLRDLSDQRVRAIEETQKEHARKIADAAKLTMTIDDCRAQHRDLRESQRDFTSAVLDLAKVQEKLENTAAFVSEVNNRVIGMVSDIASVKSLENRVERLEDRKK